MIVSSFDSTLEYKMSTWDAHNLNLWWTLLCRACEDKDGYVSAGELARYAGTSRNTAQKHVKMLVKEKAARSTQERHNAKVKKTVYCPERID